MKQKIVYIGVDVDDTQYHGSALNSVLLRPVYVTIVPLPVRLTQYAS
jgi:hypothetical protein